MPAPDLDALSRQFTEETYRTIALLKKNYKYNASYFSRMVDEHGAVETARRLVHGSIASDGFTTLYELGRLDLSVEYSVAYDERFVPLFTDEDRSLARAKLASHNFRPT